MVLLALAILLLAGYLFKSYWYPISSAAKTPTPSPNSQPAADNGSPLTNSDTEAVDALYKGQPLNFLLGDSSTVKINDHGCWKDYGSLRIMNGASQFGWEWKGCIWEAAKRNRNMCGEQAGGQCWIPADNYMTPQTAIDRSRIKMTQPAECGMGGSAFVMHLYSWSDEVRDKIANGGNPG